ncbi:MAG: glycosyl transferase family 1 [Acidobacteria bacterium]|nr:MAG: glycosyl transferase family 1 [Acidobacteriota bacterium]
MHRAFPDAAIYTSLYEPDATFPEFAECDITTSALQRFSSFRRYHRAAFPFLAPAFSRMRVTADIAICSSSGWAHGSRVSGRKIVLCHTPARWLYQPEQYLRGRGVGARLASASLRRPLLKWDQRAAQSVDRYLAVSTAVRDRIAAAYGIEAEVLHSPHAAHPGAHRTRPEGVADEFDLCVSRLLPYKNVDAIIQAYSTMPSLNLVVVGSGPDEARLKSLAGPSTRFLSEVPDEQLWWLYGNCRLLVAASYEDFGLTPLEAAAFGKPSVALRWGGFLDSVIEGETGIFFDVPDPHEIRAAVTEAGNQRWNEDSLRNQAELFSEEAFAARLNAIVNEMR